MVKYLTTTVTFLSFTTLVLIALFALLSKFNLPGGYRFYSVLTGSMEPTLPTGSLIFIKSLKSTNDIQDGQIITFQEPGYQNRYITHRVYKINEQESGRFFETKGDANKNPDPWTISYGMIRGIYVSHVPYLGSAFQFLRTPMGIALFVIVPVILLAIIEIRTIIEILVNDRLKKIKVISLLLINLISLTYVLSSTNNSYAVFVSNQTQIVNNAIQVLGTSTSRGQPRTPHQRSGGREPIIRSPEPREENRIPSPSPSPTFIITNEELVTVTEVLVSPSPSPIPMGTSSNVSEVPEIQ